ncbi:HIT family protein [Actinoplanes hulinensis]|uniref:HIT family protein n=1 Tax=Actinoplanes hulinensis TaxID=1144547 RepID=A0ABS7AZ60_9ACTN|nr:HIT family protein [Actinoplanes hulinensis]MBW6433373.1 HIT family protein [Actinoplanes hulinensis]
MSYQRRVGTFDFAAYSWRVHQGPCFVCAYLAGHPGYRHHLVYEDDDSIAFLTRFPTLLGYCVVAPKRHVENWHEDLSEEEFLGFQRTVRTVARAIAATVPTERMYSMSLGSKQGNAHLHWHLAPLPPGVPYEQQQFHAVMAENGVLPIDSTAQADLADRIRGNL